MVAKVSTIKKKIKQGKKLGFSERARAVNKGLLPSKAKIKKVMKGLQKASKTHAAQAKTLKGVLHGGSKSRNGKKA